MEKNILEMKNISKFFPGVTALDGVNLTLERGKVLGLVGENGAGKSTLMKILTGTYIPDGGTVTYKGSEVHFKNEKDALAAGISIVPQELSYVAELTVEENIFLGREQRKGLMVDARTRHREAKEAIAQLGLSIDPQAKMGDINIAQCQMIEIVKAISRGAELVVFDEPTSSLTSVETKNLLSQIKSLREKGITCIYISHKLDEIMEICDTITVLRDARYIGQIPIEEATEEKIIAMMVGREMGKIYPPVGTCEEAEVLRVEHLTQSGVFEDVSFTLHKGEVLGFAGMVGAGRSEVMRAVFGIDPHESGQIFVEGSQVKIRETGDAIKAGIAMVFEDRRIYGFVGNMSIAENIALPSAGHYVRHAMLDFRAVRKDSLIQKDSLKIKTPDVEQKVVNLSGGNQQKVVLGKWLNKQGIKVLIMDEPTRGIDVGAKQEIYEIIRELSARGMAIILISSEMPEVINVSQRILVMSSGKLVGEFSHGEATQEGIMDRIIQGGKRT